ncbi:hypothetical protein BDQ17DRAFT_1374009 [Cyathus striatus]|nr:hypothetical protein BDQ17DRAFT_1374009 [Cyathus striatus]
MPNSTFIATMSISGVLFFLVHGFFATRIFLLTKKWPVPAAIMTMSSVMLGLSAYTSLVDISNVDPFSDHYFRKKKLPIAFFHGFAAITDLIVSISLSSALLISKSNIISNGQMLQVLRRLLLASVTRGILLATIQICHLVMFILNPRDIFLWAPIHMILDQIYAITTLMILNSRTFYGDRVGLVVEMSQIDFSSSTE